MKHLYQQQYKFLFFFLMFLGACTTLGIPSASSVDQDIAYGYSSLAAVRITASDLLVRGSITVEDARMVQAQADTARAGLDQAKALLSGGLPTDAKNQLILAKSVLTALETFLKTKGVK